ncbi:CHAD domain-containing protein [Aurantibacillus circumpalustris]|uniref:CHAD domain-containing protein n=1 Tax=Aurantibacillus circumpalustris TaxID=3036359 RepID=UPI00295BBF01|nr:CHAD domain-containing protein [Aurantibacillus circumpalustris]
MGKKNVVNNYLDEQLGLIETWLNTFSQNRKPESLHALRVCIKKTKAILYFSETLFKKPFGKKKLDNLFHKAGTLRELYIIILLMQKSLPVSEKLTLPLMKKRTLLEQQFLEKIPRYIKEVRLFRKELSLPEKLPSKKVILSYFKKREKRADKKLHNRNRTTLHYYRRDIKKMMYVYEMLPKKLKKEIGLNKTKTDRLQEKIGLWHDTWTAFIFLSKQSFSKQIKNILSDLKEKEKKQFKKLFL